MSNPSSRGRSGAVRVPGRFIRFAAALLLAVLGVVPPIASAEQGGPARTAGPKAPRPNVILCMADDQGWGDMAYNGHPVLKTPVFDEMARSGLRLDRFYAAAPVCSPTRGSVLTGRTPNRYGTFSWGHSIRPEEVTIAEALREAGYATGHFGKWHVGSVLAGSPTSPGANGFDRWLSAPNFFEINPRLSDQGNVVQIEGEGSEVIVAAAIEFAKAQHAAGRPFLAVVWFGSPHVPHVGTEADLALYEDQPPKQRHFLAEITAMDRAMGHLRTALRDMGIAENTLLWYCSDNGAIAEGSTGGLRGMKGQIYEGGLRVPCLIEWPARIRAARRSAVPTGTVDIFPTVLELAGARPAHQPPLDGQSLVALIDGEMTGRDRPLGFWEARLPGFSTPSEKLLAFVAERQRLGEPVPAGHPAWGLPPAAPEWNEPDGRYPGHAAWLDGNWKLHRIQARQGEGGARWELYDLGRDDAETTDLGGQEVVRLERMKGEIEAWLKSVVASLRGEDYGG
jgi:arylsulfatase A-like enzyme